MKRDYSYGALWHECYQAKLRERRNLWAFLSAVVIIAAMVVCWMAGITERATK